MKRFTFIIALLGIAIMSFSKTNVKEVSATKEAVSTMHQDVKDVITTVHDDAKSVITTLYGDSKDAASILYPEVKGAVMSIGKAIGVAAEHVYTVLVKKFVVDAIVQLLPFLLGLLLIGIAWFKMSGYFKTHEKIEWHIIYPFILLLFGTIALSSVDYNTMVMGLVNPEYGALNYILEYSKQMIK